MGELLRLISDYSNVELAWREVLANDLADGELSPSGERFLDDDKSEVMSFDEGFVFLGEEISSKYPELLSLERSSQPDKRTLMVAKEGSVVRIAHGQVIVSQDKKDFLKVPVSSVARVVLYGAVGLSAGARSYAMGTGTPVVFCSRRGSIRSAFRRDSIWSSRFWFCWFFKN